MDVNMSVANEIQSKVAAFSHAGYHIKASDDDNLAASYTAHFYDNCVVYWEEAGYDPQQVRETVDAAVQELTKTYHEDPCYNF